MDPIDINNVYAMTLDAWEKGQVYMDFEPSEERLSLETPMIILSVNPILIGTMLFIMGNIIVTLAVLRLSCCMCRITS